MLRGMTSVVCKDEERISMYDTLDIMIINLVKYLYALIPYKAKQEPDYSQQTT